MSAALAIAPTVALVAVRDVENDFTSYWRPQVFSIDRRAARRCASSYLEGHEAALRAIAAKLQLSFRGEQDFCRRHAATYTELRNWLYGDLEFDYRLACQIALAFTWDAVV
jgi:hypothetical protein